MNGRSPALVAAYEAALAEPPVLPNTPPRVQAEHATDNVRPTTSARAGIGRAHPPRPWHPDGRDIDDYPDFELAKFMRWIMSDGVLRTRQELITIGTKELGYQRRGAKIVAALGKAIDTVQRFS